MKRLLFLFSLSFLVLSFAQTRSGQSEEPSGLLVMVLNELCSETDCGECEYHRYGSASYVGKLVSGSTTDVRNGKNAFEIASEEHLLSAPTAHSDGTCYWSHDDMLVYPLKPGTWDLYVKNGGVHKCDGIEVKPGERVVFGVGGCDYESPSAN